MWLLIGGMHRSGSTFSFNIAKELLTQTGYTQHLTTESIKEAVDSCDAKHLIIKNHYLDEFGRKLVKTGEMKAICTIRDPFEAIASYMEVFGFELDQAITAFGLWLDTYQAINSQSLIIKFNEIEQQSTTVILKVAEYLGLSVTDEEVIALNEKYEKDKIKAFTQNLSKTTKDIVDIGFSYYDKNTFFHINHVRLERNFMLTDEQKLIVIERVTGFNEFISNFDN